MSIYLLSKTKTFTLSAPFRTLGREYVGALPSLFQGVPGAREGRPAHGHVWASAPRGERVRGRHQAFGHGDGSRRRRRPPSRDQERLLPHVTQVGAVEAVALHQTAAPAAADALFLTGPVRRSWGGDLSVGSSTSSRCGRRNRWWRPPSRRRHMPADPSRPTPEA